jgi:hypothetical protein
MAVLLPLWMEFQLQQSGCWLGTDGSQTPCAMTDILPEQPFEASKGQSPTWRQPGQVAGCYVASALTHHWLLQVSPRILEYFPLPLLEFKR